MLDAWPSIRLLLVEDDEVDAENVLRGTQWSDGPPVELKWCRSLTEARAAAADDDFDAVLLDLNLPDSSGLSTVEAMVEATPTTPVIVLTSQRDMTTQLGAAAARAHDFLGKDEVDSGTLFRRLAYALERKRTVFRLLEQERMAALGSLAAGVGHDLKNPVSYVLSNLQYLEEDMRRFMSSPSPDVSRATLCEWHEAVGDCLVGAEQLKELGSTLNDMRVGGRAGASCDLEDGIRRAVAITAPLTRSVAEVRVDVRAGGHVQGDLSELVAVLVHLIRRSVQNLEASGRNGHISLRSSAPLAPAGTVDRLRLEVLDDGQPIPDADRAQLFDLFARAGEGPGFSRLGLTVAHQTCREWGWSLTHHETKEGWTCFRIEMPRAAPAGGPRPVSVTAHHEDA